MHLIGFQQHATKRECKLVPDTDISRLSEKTNQISLQVSGITLQQMEKFKYLGVLFPVTKEGAKVVKQTQYSASFRGQLPHNWSFQALQSC